MAEKMKGRRLEKLMQWRTQNNGEESERTVKWFGLVWSGLGRAGQGRAGQGRAGQCCDDVSPRCCCCCLLGPGQGRAGLGWAGLGSVVMM